MESLGSDSSLPMMDMRICSFTSRRSNLMLFWFWILAEGVDVESVVKQGDDGRTKVVVVTGPDGVAVQGGLRGVGGGGGGRGYGGDSGGYGGGGFSSGGYNGSEKWSNGTMGVRFSTLEDGTEDRSGHQSSIKCGGGRGEYGGYVRW